MHGNMDQILKGLPGGAQLISIDGSPVIVMKMQPTPGDVHVNTPLTQISVAYMQDSRNFIADRVFPNVPVAKQSDVYWTYDRGFFNRNEMAKRAPGTETKGIGYKVDATATYRCDVWGIHHDIADQVRANADSAIVPDRDATNLVSHQALIRKEVSWAAAYFTTGIWTTDITGVAGVPGAGQATQWSDANSTPIEDVRKGKRTVAESTGFEPNKLTLGRATYDNLLDHPDIVDRLKYGGQAAAGSGNPAKVSASALASLFEVEEILVMNSIQNTAAEGAANAHSFIGGKHALLSFSPAQPGLQTPSAGYTFSWTGYLGASEGGSRVSRFRMDHLRSDRVELEMAFDQRKIAADLGYFFSGIVA
jgi:hypothetical protein